MEVSTAILPQQERIEREQPNGRARRVSDPRYGAPRSALRPHAAAVLVGGGRGIRGHGARRDAGCRLLRAAGARGGRRNRLAKSSGAETAALHAKGEER